MFHIYIIHFWCFLAVFKVAEIWYMVKSTETNNLWSGHTIPRPNCPPHFKFVVFRKGSLQQIAFYQDG